MSAGFSDHFGSVAERYAASRPGYPPALFDWLATVALRNELAWDGGTGSGQTAVGLATRFARVVASDASERQLEHATAAPNIEYRCFPAESAPLADESVDVITVAQALHWFDLDRFYAEVRRVLRPGGAVVAWTYGYSIVEGSPEATAIVEDFHDRVVGQYWPPGREHVRRNYADLPFPFTPVDAPAVVMEAHWTMQQLLDYLGSSSSTARFEKAVGHDPRTPITADLAAAWGDPTTVRRIVWPLTVLAGRP